MQQAVKQRAEVLIVGAGMAGLTAASELKLAGHNVLVVEKGRGVGGRCATRRIGQAALDHGAQFLTARDLRFVNLVDEWRRAGVVEEWHRGSAGATEGHARWRGIPGMTAMAKYLAYNLDVRLREQVISLRNDRDRWIATLENGKSLSADAVVLTAPVPQSLALLEAGGVGLDAAMRTRLESIGYDRCLAVLAVLDGPSQIPAPGGKALGEDPIAWLADNQIKGVSSIPAVTIHATAAFSHLRWSDDRNEVGKELLRAAGPWLGSNVVTFQVQGWRYAKAVHVEKSGCLVLNEQPPLLIAGDAFAAPRVEGAVLSGWAAAATLDQMAPVNPEFLSEKKRE